MGQPAENIDNQKLGVIVCKDCKKEIESIDSEQVVTQYGVCSECKDKEK